MINIFSLVKVESFESTYYCEKFNFSALNFLLNLSKKYIKKKKEDLNQKSRIKNVSEIKANACKTFFL